MTVEDQVARNGSGLVNITFEGVPRTFGLEECCTSGKKGDAIHAGMPVLCSQSALVPSP